MSRWQLDEENANKEIFSFKTDNFQTSKRRHLRSSTHRVFRFSRGLRTDGVRRYLRGVVRCTTLSGTHGSWTRTDDVKQAGMPAKPTRKQRAAQRAEAVAQKPQPNQLAKVVGPAVRRALDALGHTVVGPTGMALAKRAMEGACRLYGSGDYHTPDEKPEVNSILPRNLSMGAQFSGPNGSLHALSIAATEPLGAVVTGPTAGAYNVTTFDLNVAVRKMFPQFSVLAGLYTEFFLEGMLVKFVSNASEYATGGIGDFMMVHQCNPLIAAPSGPLAFLQFENAVQCKMSRNAMLGVECKTFANRPLLVRSADNAGIPRTATDAGRLFVATNPAPTYAQNAVIGQLFVTYHIRLAGFKPDNRPDGYMHLERTGVTNSTPLGTSNSRTPVLGGAFLGTTVTSTTITLENVVQGDVLRFTMFYSNGPAVTVTASAPTLVGMALYNAYAGNTANARTAPLNGVSSAALTVDYTVIVTAALGQTVSFAFPTTGSIPGADVIIMGQIVGSGLALTEA